MTMSGPLAQALAARRTAYNARVAGARRAQPGFDPAALGRAVRDRIDPLVVAVAAVAPERTAAVVAAAFDMVVTLVGQRLIGPATRNPHVDALWTDVLPGYATLVAERPMAVVGRMTNAVVRLAATPGARVDDWLTTMRAMAPLADGTTLAAIGQIAAWRAGMAHFREGALAAADALPEGVALAAVGGRGDWRAVRAGYAGSRWWSPDGRPAGIAFGGFTGFGGPFPEPPAVAAVAQGFLVQAGDRYGLLVADVYGATLHPASAEEFAGAAQGAVSQAVPRVRTGEGTVQAGDRAIAVDLPAAGLTAVVSGDSVAITSSFSHFVLVHPWRLP